MTDTTPQDAAAKDRIIRHMNADHQASLSYYLRHYANLSSRAAYKPFLRDISFSEMKIQTSDGRDHTIPFTPPMKSWAEARTRTVDMDREARLALDISDVRITAYEGPASVPQVVIFGLCLFTFVVFATKAWILPGTWFYDKVLPYFPGGPKVFLKICEVIAWPVLVLHAGEAYWLDRSRLRKHGVERGSALWYKWVVSCFVEGVGSFWRVDAMVKSKALEKERAKH